MVVNTDGTFTYTPDADYNGTDSFTVTVSDGKGGSVIVTISVTVTPVNDPPMAPALSVTTPEGTPVNGKVTATDADGDPLSFAKTTDPAHGQVVVNTDGTFTYTPDSDYNGPDSFTVTVSDGKGGVVIVTVSITVTPVNDPPMASALSVTTPEDTPVNGKVTASDTDGDALTFAKATDPAHGKVVVNTDGTFTYTPAADYNGPDSFTVTVSDGKGGSVTVKVSVTVTPKNDPPVAQPLTVKTFQGISANRATIVTNKDGDPLTYSIANNPIHGTIEIDADGEFTYIPAPNYYGEDSFVYQVCDNDGNCSSAKISIIIDRKDDSPLVFYNGLSPNGDGDNDVWWIDGIEKFPDNEVLIFNRWGDKIIELKNYDNTNVVWDGKNSHKKQVSDGTYYYLVKIKNEKSYTGWINLRSGNN